MAARTALIVGATGAVGSKLTPLAAASHRYAKVIVLHRSPTPFAKIAKIEEHVIDFANLPLRVEHVVEDVFCCVGTTQKSAGSTQAFRGVDLEIPTALANWAKAHGAHTFVVVSSLGADPSSSSVYLKTKGEMEREVARAEVPSTYILRPSLLKGERREFRLAERVGNRALAVVDGLMLGPLRKYRAVPTETVAKAMLECAARGEPGVHVIESDAIHDRGANAMKSMAP
jgi:uncharacterized protein YbjT (DUF2867 family)